MLAHSKLVVRFEQESKKSNMVNSNSNGFGESIFVDDEHKPTEDHTVPISSEQTEPMHSESDQMEEVEMEDIIEETILDIDTCDVNNPLAVVDYIEDLMASTAKWRCTTNLTSCTRRCFSRLIL